MTSCRPHNGFGGMKRADLDGNTVVFRCTTCGEEKKAARCGGTSADGTRCTQVAATPFVTCSRHRDQAVVMSKVADPRELGVER